MKNYIKLLLVVLLTTNYTVAQISEDSELFKTLKKNDSIIFKVGFNECNLNPMEELLSEDLEFYHDKGGFQDKEAFIKAMKENICGNSEQKPMRKLVSGTMKVFTFYNGANLYAAMQEGKHEFYIKEPNKEAYIVGEALFSILWVKNNEQWKAKRVYSYEHKEAKKYAPQFEDNYPYPLFDTDKNIKKLLLDLKIPSVSIGYIENGKIQQIRAFGYQKPNDPISNISIYKVASLTKPITAIVSLKLVEAGKWSLDEPIYNYYVDPDVKNDPYLSKLTTRTILSQQSGFPNWRYLRKDKKLVFDFEPGTKYQYSGEGFEYLRKAIEEKMGKPLEELAEMYLFKPLQMEDTHFYWNSNVDEARYAVESDTEGKPITFRKYTEANAAANLLTSVSDYGKFLVHIQNGAGLSEDLYNEFIAPQSQVKEGIDFGLGMQVFSNLPNDEFALVHTGGDNGTKCIAIVLPNSKKGLIIFVNSENGLKIWKKIIVEYLGDIGKEIVRRNLE